MADLGRLIRLHGAIKAALASLPKVTDSNGLVDAYERFRREGASLVDAGEREEFERLFPARQFPRYDSISPDMAATAGEVRGLLAGLEGWIGGAVEAAKFEAQAQANAQARQRDQETTRSSTS